MKTEEQRQEFLAVRQFELVKLTLQILRSILRDQRLYSYTPLEKKIKIC